MKYIFILVILLQNYSVSYSNDLIDIKTELSTIECHPKYSIAFVDIFVKRSDNYDGDIYLENQNYRFTFNSNTFKEGTFFIEEEGDLSGYNDFGNNQYCLFGDHDLNGSIGNILSYNIDYLGGNSGYSLENDWIKVGTIGATLLTNKECVSTSILTAADFPATTLVYTNDNLNKLVDKTPHTLNAKFCVNNNCSDCLTHLILNPDDPDYTSGELFEHRVSGFIEAKNIINNHSDVIFKITDYSLLSPGFEVGGKTKFEIVLEGCN